MLIYNSELLGEAESTFFDGNTTVTLLEPTELHFVSQEVLRRYRSAWSERLRATVTIRIVNPDDATLAALLALANQPVVGTLAPSQHIG